MIQAILKHSQRAGMTDEAAAIESAFHVMTIVPNQANDMMDIGRLQGFEGKIVAQGKLLLHGPLLCTEDPTSGPNYKLKEMTVFLFEQIIIFAETVGRKNQFTSPVYTYKAHIQVWIMICWIVWKTFSFEKIFVAVQIKSSPSFFFREAKSLKELKRKTNFR